MAKNHTTESDSAPDTVMQVQVERQGAGRTQSSGRYPQVRGGVCEFCGILDKYLPSEMQYKLCPHFRGLELRCSYCPETSDPTAVVGHNVLNVAHHPDNPSKLVVWCGSYTCSEAHTKRFTPGRS